MPLRPLLPFVVAVFEFFVGGEAEIRDRSAAQRIRTCRCKEAWKKLPIPSELQRHY